MTITLINKETYDRILEIQKEYPKLTFQNVAYQCVSPTIIQEHECVIKELNGILDKAIKGFCEFKNFRLGKNGDIVIRFQYIWDAEIYFKGVGYLPVSHLLNGFPA